MCGHAAERWLREFSLTYVEADEPLGTPQTAMTLVGFLHPGPGRGGRGELASCGSGWSTLACESQQEHRCSLALFVHVIPPPMSAAETPSSLLSLSTRKPSVVRRIPLNVPQDTRTKRHIKRCPHSVALAAYDMRRCCTLRPSNTMDCRSSSCCSLSQEVRRRRRAVFPPAARTHTRTSAREGKTVRNTQKTKRETERRAERRAETKQEQLKN